MDGIAAASVQQATAQLQQSVQLNMLKKANDNDKDMMARVLASTQPAAPASASPAGIGQLVDLRA